MALLETFMNTGDDGLPVIVRAGLTHVQFETIHPFLDGNGRVGRMLITLLLCRAGSALRVHEAIKARPITSVQRVSRSTGLSFPAASKAMEFLVEIGIARELTGNRRNRIFAYSAYLDILSEGMEAL